jgi:hypothetical protein
MNEFTIGKNKTAASYKRKNLVAGCWLLVARKAE